MQDELTRFAEETIEELLTEMPVERRLKGLSPDQLLAALSPETRAELAQLLSKPGSLPAPRGKQPPAEERKP